MNKARIVLRESKMAVRVLASSTMALCKSLKHHQLKNLSINHIIFTPWFRKSLLRQLSFWDVSGLTFYQEGKYETLYGVGRIEGKRLIHSGPVVNEVDESVKRPMRSRNGATNHGDGEKKRRKPKGKALVKWLKNFRWKKRNELQRMTAEEKILYKLKKARNKEERLIAALKKIEPACTSEVTHDPEILTPEERHYFLKMGLKCKNYVPVGTRGIYQGVILNMHLHWKKHQTLLVTVKTFTPDEVKEIASELARLTGGIVLDIHEEKTIIMYRGKNYSQPPTEIMSPRVTLGRKKALDKSKCIDRLKNVRKYIPRLEQELVLLQEQAKREFETSKENQRTAKMGAVDLKDISNSQLERSYKVQEVVGRNQECLEDDEMVELGMTSDSEDLSDFETNSEAEPEEEAEQPLYMDIFDKFPTKTDEKTKGFEEHLCQMPADEINAESLGADADSPKFDEVDMMFLRAISLLKRKRR